MPGNELGDRIHNFFGQENLLQGQYQLQAADGNWSELKNNALVGSQRQIGAASTSNLKSYNAYQSEDSEGGRGNHSFHTPHGLNSMQSNVRAEFGRTLSQNQRPTLNGCVQGHQIFHTRHNESNFMEVDSKSGQNLTSGGLSIHEAQEINGPEPNNINSFRLETADSPVSFDFFGGQRQMNRAHLSMMQPLPRQQSGVPDMQLLQQQAMLAQIRELQRQQQLEQLDARNQSSMNQISSAKQTTLHHSPAMINSVTVNEVSNYPWQHQQMTSNVNWLHRGASPVMQGSSSGLTFPSEQNQAMGSIGLIPRLVDQSLYGVPVSTTGNISGTNSFIESDKPVLQQLSTSNESSLRNQYPGFPDQLSLHDGASVLRQDFHGKNIFALTDGQGLNGGLNSENLQQVHSQQSNAPAQDVHGSQEAAVSPEMSQEISVMQVAPSRNLATLDPTEEKILYGSDDNLWDTFGRTTNMGSGGYNMLNGSDFYNGLPSSRSGPWSALMQSAVAETSSGDVGTLEEWNGLNFQTSNGIQLPVPVNDSSKLQPLSVDSNSQTVSTLNYRPSSISVDACRPNTASANNAPTFMQPGQKPSVEHNEGLKTDSGQRFTSQFSEGGSKWTGHIQLQKPLADGNHASGNINHSSGSEINTNNISGSWASQQSISSYSDNQQFKPNGWNFIKSLSSDGGGNRKNHENLGLWQTPKGGDERRAKHEDMANTSVMCKTDSIMNSDFESQHAKPAIESQQFYNEGSMKNDAALANSSTCRADEENRQQHPNSLNLAFWNDVDSSVNSKGNSFPGRYRHHLNDKPQILESSRNSGVHKGAAEMHETVTSNKNENSNDGFSSSISPHVSSGGWQENHLSDASEARTFLGSKQKSVNSSGQKQSLSHKFQYHPMANLDVDVEPSYGTKHGLKSCATTQQQSHVFESYDQGSSGKSKSGHTARNCVEVEKDDTRGLGEVPSERMLPSFLPAASVSFNNFVSDDIPHKNRPSSQNMLELLQKVDQPMECDTVTQISHSNPSNQYLSSEMPNAENSEEPDRARQNQSASPQGFGLELGPPSQRFPIPGTAQSSPSSSQTVKNSSYVTFEMGGKGNTWLTPAASIQSFPNSSEQSQGEFRNNISGPSGHEGNKPPQFNSQGSFSADFGSSFPRPLSHLQNQHKRAKQSACVSSERIGIHSRQSEDYCQRIKASQSTLVADISGSAPQITHSSSAEASQLRSACTSQSKNAAQSLQESGSGLVFQHAAFSKVPPNVWANLTSQQHILGAQPSKAASDLFKSCLQSDNNFETSSSGSKKLDGQDTEEVGISPAGACSVNPQSFVGREQLVQETCQETPSSSSQGKEAVRNHLSEASPPNSDATQKDIEGFGRSLGPSSSWNQQYSMLHQMQAMKSSEIDPHNLQSEKRSEGPDSGGDPLQIPLNGAHQLLYLNKVREASLNQTSSISSGDSQMLGFVRKPWDSRDGFAFDRSSAHNISTGNIGSCGGEHSQVSPLMAPSWFDQYGTFKNGKKFPEYAGHKNTPVKPMDPPQIVRNPLNSLIVPDSMKQADNAFELSNANQNSTLISMTQENFSSSHILPPDIIDHSLVVMRQKKRKCSTSELLPWHKELARGSQQLQTISMADLDWAQAANRLIEKMEDEIEMIEDGSMMFRPKKRLILTTQLMQQLLRPPPQAVLSADSSLRYENVAYIVARLALRDACNAVSCFGIHTALLPDSRNPLSGKLKPPADIGDHKLTEVMEDFVGRARKLENEFLRMEKSASILDLRAEFQDLEKFSVINRFAKFHGRGQADGCESSSFSDATATSQKYCLHRYVTALPMPRNLPDRVQCLSM